MKSYLKVVAALGLVSAGACLVTMTRAEDRPKPATSEKEQLSAALEEAVRENVEAMNKEDVDLAVSCVHSLSPNYAQTAAVTRQINAQYDLQYKLLSFKYIGTDGEYAVARVKQQTSKIKGPAFRDNTVDVMHVFRKEGKQWKCWQSAILEVKYLEQEPPARTRPAAPQW